MEVRVDPPFLRTAYTSTPPLIGRPEATPRRATGCAVYQLTSAYRTKEQQSGWWGSASSPTEFSALLSSPPPKHPALLLGDRKHITVLPPERGQLRCWKYWLSRATGRTGKLSEQRLVSHGAGSWSSLLLTAPRRTASCALCCGEPGTGRFRREAEPRGVCGEIKRSFLWSQICTRGYSGKRHRDALRSSAACKFGLKAHRWKFTCRCLGLAEASCRSVCSQYFSLCIDFKPMTPA